MADSTEEQRVAALRAAIDAGDASGVAEGDVFKRVREKLNLPLISRREMNRGNVR